MADEGEIDRASWLLEPPGAGEVRLVVELGEGAELTPDVAASLEALMGQLSQAEVEGFMLNTGFANIGLFGGINLNATCGKLVCNRNDCDKLSCDTYKSNLY